MESIVFLFRRMLCSLQTFWFCRWEVRFSRNAFLVLWMGSRFSRKCMFGFADGEYVLFAMHVWIRGWNNYCVLAMHVRLCGWKVYDFLAMFGFADAGKYVFSRCMFFADGRKIMSDPCSGSFPSYL